MSCLRSQDASPTHARADVWLRYIKGTMMFYPFNHECQWRGPFYIWASNQVDEAPPKDCRPVYTCCICSAQLPASSDIEERQ